MLHRTRTWAHFALTVVVLLSISVVFAIMATSFIIIIFSSLMATLAEFYAGQIKINDNLSIPVCYCLTTVSYTHLDVYKRQVIFRA